MSRIEISREDDIFVGRMQTALGGNREYTGSSFDRVLTHLVTELLDEFELEG